MNKHSRMPNFYRPMCQGARADEYGPLRWQDDVTGVLPKAVMAVLETGPDTNTVATPAQIELVRDYCDYYINAPCWRTDGAQAEFTRLRERVKNITTFQELDVWLHDALEVGIDPL